MTDTEQAVSKPLREQSAEELKAGLKARTSAARARAKTRVTPEELLAKQAAKTAARSGAQSRVRASTCVGVALMLVAATAAISASQIASNSERKLAEGNAHIDQLTGHVDYLKGASSTGTGKTGGTAAPLADVSAVLEQAREAGNKVAELQNQFPALLASNSASAGNGAPSQGVLAAVAHRKDLAPFFAPGTYLLDDSVVYSATSELGLGPKQIDPRLQWFDRIPSAGAYRWRVAAVTGSESGSPSLSEVSWLCEDSASGQLLGWAVGTWSKDTKSFTKLTVGTTVTGDQQNALNAKVGE
ncbi:MAG TPA: hypothetical protein VFU07_05235 [Candidatus Lumbricidophila sp.]|nr:hypothetical protein [Candidatus Lumbricidophila sp.]